ncbi:MAG TPA: DUF6526 family protein [Chitinophagaceae bacterium]|nr:DUF6526 family protein [Chitinophagaceae bacterium]
MKEQNYKNHGRYVFIWHVVTALAVVASLIGSIVNLVYSPRSNYYSASLLVLVSLILCSIFWYARAFALKAQDRAIRAEENFRHFILTGKPLDGRLKMSQIIALRFADDEELPDLAKRASDEVMSSKEIKLAVKKWKADHHRA